MTQKQADTKSSMTAFKGWPAIHLKILPWKDALDADLVYRPDKDRFYTMKTGQIPEGTQIVFNHIKKKALMELARASNDL